MDFNNDSGTLSNVSVISTSLGNVVIQGTGAVSLPSGSTSQRPPLANGLIRLNSDTGYVEAASGNTWVNISNTISNGLPTGGTSGDVLIKSSNSDYDAAFGPITADMAPYAKKLITTAKNDSTATILKGTPVYETGHAGSSFTVLVRPADAADPLKMPAIGVLGEDLVPAQEGMLISLGEIQGVNTLGFVGGDEIYVAAGGGYTNVKPTATNVAVQFLGIVTKIHETNGGGLVTGTGTIDLFRDGNNMYYGWSGTEWEQLSKLSDLTTANIQLTGDITGTGHLNNDVATTLANVGTAGSYVSVTTDGKGRVISGSLSQTWDTITNTPTTLTGYGITDAYNKTYIDALIASGTAWDEPVDDPCLVGIAASVPTSPTWSVVYIAYGGTYPQTWGTVTNVASGDAMLWYKSAWSKVTNIFSDIHDGHGCRFLVAGVDGTPDTSITAAPLLFRKNDLVQWVIGATDPTLASSWTFHNGRANDGGSGPYIPSGTTVMVSTSPTSDHYGVTLMYNGTDNSWIQIAGPGYVQAGTALKYNAQTLNVQVDGTYVTTTSGNLTLTDVNLTTGTFGSATQVPQIVVNSKGQLTSVSNIAIPNTVSIIGDATGSGTTSSSTSITLAAVNSNIGTFGSATQVPTFTVNAKGLMTSVANVTIPNSLTFTGNVTGSGNVGSSMALTLETAGTAGTYRSVTTDAYGRVTAGTNPTTLSGYSITDAAPIGSAYVTIGGDATLTGERSLIGTTNQITITDGGANSTATLAIAANPVIPGTGSVTLPTGLAAARPATPTAGMLRFSTTLNALEYYTGVTWATVGSSSAVGTVTTLSVVSANGLAGTVATPTSTPAITLSTTVTGMVKGNGTALSAAVDGVDYVKPTAGTGVGLRQVSQAVTPISGTTSKVDSNTSPVFTDGTQVWAYTITPKFATSNFAIDGGFYIDHDTNNRRIVCGIWRTVGAVNTLVGVSAAFITASGNGGEIAISFYDQPATTSPITYSLRVWTGYASGSPGTWYVAQGVTPVFNGNLGKQILRLTETA